MRAVHTFSNHMAWGVNDSFLPPPMDSNAIWSKICWIESVTSCNNHNFYFHLSLGAALFVYLCTANSWLSLRSFSLIKFVNDPFVTRFLLIKSFIMMAVSKPCPKPWHKSSLIDLQVCRVCVCKCEPNNNKHGKNEQKNQIVKITSYSFIF